MNTYLIAEMGSSWLFGRTIDGQRKHGIELIQAAATCGAKAVKTQWTSDHRKMERRRKVAEGSYTGLQWPIEWHQGFAGEAHRLGMEYIVTVFLPCDVKAVYPHVDRFKVASLEFRSASLRKALAKQSKPVIYSTGVCASHDISESIMSSAYKINDHLLYCTASYPCPAEEMNLAAMRVYGFANSYDGLSDHSRHVVTGAFAVMRGATIVEAHIRLNETPRTNPDYGHSLAPWEFAIYADNILLAETMLGDGNKKIEKGERALMKHRVRR